MTTMPTEVGTYWVKTSLENGWIVVEITPRGVIITMGNSDFPLDPKYITKWGPKIEPPNG